MRVRSVGKKALRVRVGRLKLRTAWCLRFKCVWVFGGQRRAGVQDEDVVLG